MSAQYRICIHILLFALMSSATMTTTRAAKPTKSAGLTLEWEDKKSKGPRSSTWLSIHGDTFPKPILIHYLEAYVRPNSTDEDWGKSIFGHKTELLSFSKDKKQIKLKDTLSNGVIVHHTITAKNDEVDFQLKVHNPTKKVSNAHWAQPCVRVGDFSGKGKADTTDAYAYIKKSFIFVDGKLARMPTPQWAMKARYIPGQVWCPLNVPRTDVNPRPLSKLVPSNGLIGCFNDKETLILGIAWEPYQELFQGVIRCLHSDFRLGSIKPGEKKTIRGKIYIVKNDVDELLKRYNRDFPEHTGQK